MDHNNQAHPARCACSSGMRCAHERRLRIGDCQCVGAQILEYNAAVCCGTGRSVGCDTLIPARGIVPGAASTITVPLMMAVLGAAQRCGCRG